MTRALPHLISYSIILCSVPSITKKPEIIRSQMYWMLSRSDIQTSSENHKGAEDEKNGYARYETSTRAWKETGNDVTAA